MNSPSEEPLGTQMHTDSPERIIVTYQYFGSDPKAIADHIRTEQTIEFPFDLAPNWIQEEIVGQIESITEQGSNTLIRISYSPDVVAGEFTQLLNVLWGNASLIPGLKVVDVSLPDVLTKYFPGPRFGVAGLRSLFKIQSRPLLTTALKPMGSSVAELADMGRTLTQAGFDIIKDDHSLANQPWATWRDRVEILSAVINEASEISGKKTIYCPSLNLPHDQIVDAAYFAKEKGAGALLVLPGITGFDSMRKLATTEDIALPIQAHPSFLGSYVMNPQQGLSHGLLFGTLMRLAGADISIFPNAGGRFSFSEIHCEEIVNACRAPMQAKTIWPAPAGGMTIDRIPQMVQMYGSDIGLLIGGALSRGNLAKNAEAMAKIVNERSA